MYIVNLIDGKHRSIEAVHAYSFSPERKATPGKLLFGHVSANGGTLNQSLVASWPPSFHDP